jgi:hypothetical protein
LTDLLAAIGLMLAIEGLLFLAFPAATRRAMEEAVRAPDALLQRLGLVCAGIGVALLFVAWRVI